jgi:soluble lytic murein transglycosylase-like protein
MSRLVCRSRRLNLSLAALVLAAPACARGGPAPQPSPVSQPVATAPSHSAAGKQRSLPTKRGPAAPTKRGPAAPARAARPRPQVDSTAMELALTARLAHRPLARALARRTRNPDVAERAAWALVREAGRQRVSPSLLAAVLLIENRALDSSAVSSQGAIGMMQVMPIHAGGYGCGSADLRTIDTNICLGARVLHTYIRRTRSVHVALRRYNGCVRGTNTPRCHRYPGQVLLTASRLRREMLATAADAGVIVPES